MKKDKIIKITSLILMFGLLTAGIFYSKWKDRQMIPEDQQIKKMDRDEYTVTWNVGFYWQRDDDFTTYFNGLLKKYGCPYRVEFQMGGFNFDVHGNQGFIEPYDEAFFENTDIVTLVDNSIYAQYYDYYGQKGAFLKLDDLLQTEEGKKLYASYPNIVWESLKINGEIYGTSSDWLNRKFYLILNQDILKQYNIVVENHTLEEWLSIADNITIAEKKNGNSDFLGGAVNNVKSNLQYDVIDLGKSIYNTNRWFSKSSGVYF